MMAHKSKVGGLKIQGYGDELTSRSNGTTQRVTEHLDHIGNIYNLTGAETHLSGCLPIALIVNNLDDSDKFDLQVQLLLLASKFDNRIEPYLISTEDFLAENPFAFEIMKTGIEIEL